MRSLDPVRVPLRGRHLVEASAGTGKTFTISTLFVRLVAEEELEARQILVVTFTRAATAELRERIRKRLVEAVALLDGGRGEPVLQNIVQGWSEPDRKRELLRRAIADFDLAPVFTIHGFCQRALRENAFESLAPFEGRLVEDRTRYVREVTQDLWTGALFRAERAFVEWLQRDLAFHEVVELAQQAVRAAPALVLPETDPPALAGQGERVREAFRVAARAWREGGHDAVALIDRCGVLDGRIYQPGRTRKHAECLDACFRAASLPFGHDAFTTALAYFDPERMAAKRSKAAVEAGLPAPTSPALEALGALRATWDEALEAFVAERVRLCRHVMAEAPRSLEAARKAADDLQFFDDLIVDLDRALQRPEGRRLAEVLRHKYAAALIDEFQDTDPVQYRVFRAVYGHDHHEVPSRLFLIGDPKQAIYAFRGADLHAYLQAREEIPPEHRWNLGTNHRSDAALVEAVNHLFSRGPDPFGEARIPFHPVAAAHGRRLRIDGEEPPPLWFRVHRNRGWGRLADWAQSDEIPAAVADDVVNLLRRDTRLHDPNHPDAVDGWRPLHPGDIAVLVSSHFEAGEIQQALEARGVPCVRYGNVRVFDTPEALDLLALLEAVTRPNDLPRVRAALITPLLGLTADDLGRLDPGGEGVDRVEAERELQVWLERLRGWRETWDRRGFMRMFQQVVHETDALARVLGTDGGERRMTNLRHLAELVHAAEQAHDLRPLGCVAWLAAQRAGRGDAENPAEVRLESDDAAVQVVTMHVSKGLEYPVVFCPYLWRPSWRARFPIFHDRDGQLRIDLAGSEESVEAALAEARAERLRLAYVALTRARNLCIVTWGRFRARSGDFSESALAHLLHPPADGGPPGASAPAVAALDEAALFRHVAELDAEVAADGGDPAHRPRLFAASWVEEPSSDRYERPRPPSELWQPRPPRARFAGDLRLSSFSKLVAAAHAEVFHDDAERDVDADAAGTGAPAGEELVLAGFPRGARAGTAYHAALEGLDFRRAAEGGPEVEAHVRAALLRHGFGDDAHVRAVVASVRDVCATPLGGGAPRLEQVAPDDRIDELEFLVPAGGAHTPLTAERLARAFAEHGPPRLADAVAARIAGLGFRPLHGALKGFVDLVFVHDGRFWLVDYKTNHLGDRLDDYAPDALDREMLRGDYVLQYHLYAVALARFLRRRVPGFDWDTHFGGVRYLFVRGMTPATGPERGVFADRPTRVMIEALDRALGEAP